MYAFILLLAFFPSVICMDFDLNSFEGHNATWILNCLGTFGVNSYSDFCNGLLSKVYGMCSSFDIATARCQKDSTCRSTASVSDWCYFGTGMVANCPGFKWNNLSSSALTIENSCINAEQANSNKQPQGYWLVNDSKIRTILLISFACKLFLLSIWYSTINLLNI